MANKFTPKAKEILEKSKKISSSMSHSYVGSEHLLLAIMQTPDCIACNIIKSRGGDLAEIEAKIRSLCTVGKGDVTSSELTPSLQSVIQNSHLYSSDAGEEFTGSQHLLLSLICEDGCLATRILESIGISSLGIKNDVQAFTESSPISRQTIYDDFSPKSDTALTEYGKDLTELAKSGKLSPVIGRENETQRLIRILCRKSKNNPCLIGEPGVGKTAIVEGLAEKIVSGNVPEILLGKKIISLDLSRMISGAKYRGEFEERLKRLMREVEDSRDIILFIDEIHTIVGAGSAEGALDASNIIKPSLSRGEIQLIGATTVEEYRRIEKDSALERRFQPITVNQPTKRETLEILKGLRASYEAHHGIRIPDEALTCAIDLSVRYINDRFLPDKAIDVLDEASSELRLKMQKRKKTADNIQRQLKIIFSQKENAVLSGDTETAGELRKKEIALEKKLKNLTQKKLKVPVLSSEDIAGIVTKQTGIPVSKLVEKDSERLLELHANLTSQIYGQDEAVRALCSAIRRGRTGLGDPSRPIGSFIFAGASGVGKTGLAKALATALFGSEKSLIRIDMSEYMEPHSVSKLIGSPPGYVGYGEGGFLTEKIRRAPYSVILFDEIEKAHRDIFNILLQILDDGVLSDSCGRSVNFKNTVIIMTSNIGFKSTSKNKLGFGGQNSDDDEKKDILSAVKRAFSPEFINRVDNIIVFRRLDGNDLYNICKKMLDELTLRLKGMKIEAEFDTSCIEYISKLALSEDMGARALKHNIESHIENVLSDMLISGELRHGDSVLVFENNRKLEFKIKS